jgi:uncharacterized C2H2 Zn-finger protein
MARGPRVTMTCQAPQCGKVFHDFDSYFAHVSSHEEESKVKKEDE